MTLVRVLVMRCSLLALVLLAGGCAYWGRRAVSEPTPLDRDDPVWIWSGGKVEKWHAVVITENSVSGIPYRKPLKCESCVRSLPRTQVDSMKVGYHTTAETIVYLTGLVVLLIL